jgi:hypothetical protein
VRSRVLRLNSVLDDDDAEWGLPRRGASLAIAIAIAIAVVPIVLSPLRDAYAALLREDGPVEWAQVACLVPLVVADAWLAIHFRRLGLPSLTVLYVVAAVVAVFVTGEELSWGQRIFHWLTPAGMATVNTQDETNLHNVGPLLTWFNVVSWAICLVALILPVVRWTIWSDRPRSIEGFALIPPLALAPFFALVFAYRSLRLVVLPDVGYTLTRYTEATELALYFALLAFAVLLVRKVRRERAAPAGPDRMGI